MLVLVVAQVLGGHASFMLAINRRCDPSPLDRQQQQHANEHKTTHFFSVMAVSLRGTAACLSRVWQMHASGHC
jgi:hypothetical protein